MAVPGFTPEENPMSHLRAVTEDNADDCGLNEPLYVDVALGDPDYGNVYVTLNYDNGGAYRFVLAHHDAASIARLLQTAHAQAEERTERDRAEMLAEVAEMPDDPDVRISHRQNGWILPDYSDYAECCINTQQPNGPQCTATAVWQVIHDHGMHQTLTWWCDQHLPAEHRTR